MGFFYKNWGKILAAVLSGTAGGIGSGFVLGDDALAEFLPVVIIIILICGALGGGAAQLASDFSANPGESFAYNMEKFAPAANGTTGFLLISFIVIILLGNIMINTCPDFIEGSVSNDTDPTSGGFVSWLQTNYPGISWSIAVIPVIIITIITFLPIRDKPLKILIASVILVGLTTAALLFNSIKRLLFGKKDSFTNVKEEFGHMVDNEGHPFKIAVGTQKWDEANIDNQVYYRLNNDYEEHKEDTNEYQNPGTTNYGTGNINVNYDTYNDKLQINLDRNENHGADIYMSEVPWGKGTAETLKKITTDTITVSIEEVNSKTIYLHSFETGTLVDTNAKVKLASVGPIVITTVDDISSIALDIIDGVDLVKDNKILLTSQIDTAQNGVYTIGTVTAAKTIISKEPTQTLLIKVTDGTTNKNKHFSTSDDGKTWTEIVDITTDTKVVLWEGLTDGKLTKNEGRCKSIVLTDGKEGVLSSSKYPIGVTLNIKNVEKGFEIQGDTKKAAVKSIITSYHIYYPLVWGSILVYTIFQKLKGVDFGVTVGEIMPFIIAAVLETLLVIQSNSSFGVSKDDDNKDKVFRYALVSYATRVATVVAFLSTIITNVEEG